MTLVLDFGGVITRTLFETHADTEHALNLEPGTLTWCGPFDPAGDALWRAMCNDEISEREYWLTRTREVGKQIGKNWTEMSQFVRAARAAEPERIVRPEALKAIEKSKNAGCKLAILSNELDLFYGSDFRKRLPFMAGFDVISDATYTHILKPDPRAYRICIDALEVSAEDCVFVDDQLRNIKGARAVGMQTVHFNVQKPQASYQQALDLLGISG